MSAALSENQCGTLEKYFEDFDKSKLKVLNCFKDKTVIVIGDSRARQLAGELLTFLDDVYRYR